MGGGGGGGKERRKQRGWGEGGEARSCPDFIIKHCVSCNLHVCCFCAVVFRTCTDCALHRFSKIYTQFRDQAEPLLEQYRSSRDSSLLHDFGVAGLLAQHMFLHQEVREGRLTASEIEPAIKSLEEMMVDELEPE